MSGLGEKASTHISRQDRVGQEQAYRSTTKTDVEVRNNKLAAAALQFSGPEDG